MIIWVPLVIYTYAIGDTWQATGLLLYSVIVTGNVDYIARITLLKRMGNVHPVITILGVIVGLGFVWIYRADIRAVACQLYYCTLQDLYE